MEINKKELKKILKEQREEYQNYIGSLKEDFDSRVETVGEGWQAVQEKVDATFDMVGEINVKVTELRLEIEKIKKDIEIVKSDISFIKNGLKQKVDREEFVVLEKRLILLENKFKRV